MKIKRKLLIAAALATAAPSGLMSQGALAQDELEEIIVTGSYIKRNREELSTPVDVYDRSEFEAAGSPTAVDIIQNMPAVSGTVNRSEQFGNGGVITGLKMVNIRGLGMGRTLVLMNGKRIVNNGSGTNSGEYPVDIGNFPNIALQRIELLKAGGSTTYGTEAIAGTFNFITRSDFEGLEVRASHSFIDGSDGDTEVAGIWGVNEGSLSWVTSIEYNQKSRLSNADVGDQTYNAVLDGGWPLGISSFGNPGTFWALDFSRRDVDPECGFQNGAAYSFDPGDVDGGYAPGSSTYSLCGYNYVPFSNVIDPQKRLKVFSEMKMDVNDNVQVYGEVLVTSLEADYYGSPSYPPTAAGYFTYIPPTNPGFADFVDGLTASGDATAAASYAGGALWWGRSLATQGPSYISKGLHETNRFVFGIRGMLPFADDISYDLSVNHSTEDNRSDQTGGKDILTARFNAALSGMGGPLCDAAKGGTPGDALTGGSCYYFNPAGSSIAAAPGSVLYNDPVVRDWFTGETSGQTHQKLLTIDGVLSGEAFELPAGPIGWAAGGQWRYWSREYRPLGDNRVDGPQGTPFHFLGVNLKSWVETRNFAFFGEASIPVLETLTVDVGARYEDYGIGNVLRPKVSAHYQVIPELALRASFEQVFRTPVVGSQSTRSLELVGAEYVTIETPVPTGLDPEQADSINVGGIFTMDGWSASVDYFILNLEGPFARESIGNGTETILDGSGNIVKIIAERINGEAVEVEGIDFAGSYSWDMYDTDFQIGVSGILNTKYDVTRNDGTCVWNRKDPAGVCLEYYPDGSVYDALGKFNFRSTDTPINVRSTPELKLNASFSAVNGPHHARLFVRYISSFDMDVSSSDANKVPFGLPSTVDESITFDAHYSLSLMEDRTQLSFSVINVMDEDAPLAPHEIGYDGSTHSALGRVMKVAIRHQF